MNKRTIILTLCFYLIMIPSLIGIVRAQEINLPPPETRIDSEGNVHASWEQCNAPNLYEYDVRIACVGCEASYIYERTEKTEHVFSKSLQSYPLSKVYKKIEVWIIPLDSKRSAVLDCIYERGPAMDNPAYDPDSVTPPDKLGDLQAPTLLSIKHENELLHLEWKNNQEGIAGTMIKQVKCLTCEDSLVIFVDGADITQASTNPMVLEGQIFVTLSNFMPDGISTPSSPPIAITLPDGEFINTQEDTEVNDDVEEEEVEEEAEDSFFGRYKVPILVGGGAVGVVTVAFIAFIAHKKGHLKLPLFGNKSKKSAS